MLEEKKKREVKEKQSLENVTKASRSIANVIPENVFCIDVVPVSFYLSHSHRSQLSIPCRSARHSQRGYLSTSGGGENRCQDRTGPYAMLGPSRD